MALQAVHQLRGVRSATVSLDTEQASVRWVPGAGQNVPALVQAVEAAGYGAKVSHIRAYDEGAHKLAGWQLNLWLGVLGTIPLMLGE